MIDRRKTPWGAFMVLLILMAILVYYLCGLFKIPGVSLSNYQEKFLHILQHPFSNWWTEQTLSFMGVALIAWVMLVAWYTNYYRNTHLGAENGTEQWGDVKRLSKTLRDKREENNTLLSRNIAVSNTLLSNRNMLVIGGSGSYKTTSIVAPNLLLASNTNVFLDIKGELLRKFGKYLVSKGILVKSLNLINPEESDRYNPFAYIEKETDLIRLITNMQASVKPPDAMKGDPFWDDGVALYLQAMFYYEWLQSKEEGRQGTLNNILRLVNLENRRVDEEGTTALQVEMDRLAALKGDSYPPVRDYRKLKEGATETVRSIIIMVNAMLRLCEISSIRRILEDDDMDIKSLGLGVGGDPSKKTALFLVMPDNDPSFNFFISMFYTQLFDVLTRTADFECGGFLPIHVRLWADEFYAGPKPNNTEVLMGTIRGRNMSIVPVLQSAAQIKALFTQDKWEIFMDNCAAVVYLGSGPASYSTHKYISDLLGEMTIDTRTDGISKGSHGNSSINNARAGRALMTPAEVKRMPRNHCIIFLEGQYPIYDKKAIPFQTKRWLEAQRMALPKGYKHPVKVIYNEETMSYRTITKKASIQFLDKKDVEFYKMAEKTDETIKVFEMEEKDFLYLNWRKQPPLTEEEISDIFQQAKQQAKKDGRTAEDGSQDVPEDVLAYQALQKAGSGESGKQAVWDLSGSLAECIKRYAKELTDEQMNEILEGMEAGLSEKQVKSYFHLPAEKMNQYKRAYIFGMGN